MGGFGGSKNIVGNSKKRLGWKTITSCRNWVGAGHKEDGDAGL